LKEFYPKAIISIGDTPACSIVQDLSGADEIRPGNFVYYDLMQEKLGSCQFQDIAVSVACPVTGIYPERNEIVIYGGAIHLSKEYLEEDGRYFGLVVQYEDNEWSSPVPGTRVVSISQEHGMIKTTPEFIASVKHGDMLGILPVHSCLTANLLQDHTLFV
jgi:D-serine deaminase-like pyridoxal phosphate-dependent protein